MADTLNITAAGVDSALLDLPWDTPLGDWPTEILAALPRGISRHIVRFVKLGDRVIAVKEISKVVAHHEYQVLWELARVEAPSVIPLAVVTGRRSKDGEELNAALITEHLQFSLPYRALFSRNVTQEVVNLLLDALAVLMVRLHLLGLYWGDVSLSNTLFRRDAGAYSAYLVDAETGELHPTLTRGQREYDLDLARINIIGELMDLQAGGFLEQDEDAIAIGDRVVRRYNQLWMELTQPELIQSDERWRVQQRIDRLRDLGFSVGELTMKSEPGGERFLIQPKVVDAGYNRRQIMRLVGIDAEELQARRMMEDLEQYRAVQGHLDQGISQVAHKWMTNVFEPVVKSVPPELSAKLDPPQIFHEVLEHRWYLAQERGHDIPLNETIESYLGQVLPKKRDEAVLLSGPDNEVLAGYADLGGEDDFP